MKTTDLTDEQQKLAVDAIYHALNAIADDPRKYWLIGPGTGTYAKLTEAHAAIHGSTVEKIRESFRPDAEAYDKYCERLEQEEEIVRQYREAQEDLPVRGVEDPCAIDFDSWWLEIGQFLEPVASLSNVPNDDGKSDRELIEQFRQFARRCFEQSSLEVE